MTQGGILSSRIGLFDKKFDIALNLTKTQYLLEDPDYKSDESTHVRLVIKNLELKPTYGVEIIAKIFNIILASRPTRGKKLIDHLITGYESLTLQEEHLFKNHPNSTIDEIFNQMNRMRSEIRKPSLELFQFYDFMLIMDKLLTLVKGQKNISFTNLPIIDLEWIPIYSTVISAIPLQSFFLIKVFDQVWLCPLDQVTMIHNKIHETFNVLCLSWLNSRTIWSKEFYRLSIKLIQFMLDKVSQLGNKAYTLFKNFDGISSAFILLKEPLFVNDDQLRNIFNDLIADKLVTDKDVSLLDQIFNRDPHESQEFVAFGKLLGHPAIDTAVGINKLRERTLSPNNVTREEVSYLISSMKKNFIHQYFLKHRRWPKVEFSESAKPRLRFCCLHNIWIHNPIIPSELGPVNLKDFSAVTIEKVIEFDKLISQFPLLKDTSLAAVRREIESPVLHNIRGMRMKRTLLYFLLSHHPHINVDTYMQQLIDNNPLAFEYLVIKLTQKERELKLEGRFFGQSPYVERARRCIIEYNVSKALEKYNNSQAMTLTELQKFTKLYTLSRLSRTKSDVKTITFSIDVEAFNNNFRRSVCEPVGKEFFNKIFGVEHFSHIMDTFEKSLFTVTDGILTHKWEGQYGGIEVLFQKFWTWIYESVASRVAELTGFQHFIMVNGDDLRVVLVLPSANMEAEGKQLLERIAKDFESNYKKFGFKLKLQDTYYSSEYIGFGKIYLYRGAFCSNILKKGAKLHGMANLTGDYPMEYLKGVMSECLSTMSYGCNHRNIYLLGLVRYQMYLCEYDDTFIKLSPLSKLSILLFPSSFGGLPMLPYIRCLYKGESDVETIWISLYTFILDHKPSLGKELLNLIVNNLKKADEYESFVQNPYGLPNRSPQEGSTVIRQFVRLQLPKVVENEQFKKVLNKVSDSKRSLFIRRLMDCSPTPGKVISVFYSTSAAGLVDEFSQKFVNSKSVTGLVTRKYQSYTARRILVRAKNMDINRIRWCIKKADCRAKEAMGSIVKQYVNQSPAERCPTAFSEHLRNFFWNRTITGITYPCIVDQCHFFCPLNMDKPEIMDYTTIIREEVSSESNPNYQHGSYKLYLGNHTHLKLMNPALELRHTSPGLQRTAQLLKAYTMLGNLGEECENYVKRNLLDLTGLDPDKLVSICYKSKSGSTTHRLPTNHWSPLCGNNSLNNRSSFISIGTGTDYLSRVRPGDFTINYGLQKAHIYLTLMYTYEFSSHLDQPKSLYWMRIDPCPTCTFEVTDKPVTWKYSVPDINFDIYDNVYVNITSTERIELEENLSKVLKSYAFIHSTHLVSSEASHIDLARRLMASNLLAQHSDRLISHLGSSNIAECSEEDLNNLFLITSLDLANLTDMKNIPPSYLHSELVKFLRSWIFANYPYCYNQNGIIHLMNLHVSQLPFRSITLAMLECGYWQVFRDFLRRTYLSEPPAKRSDDVGSIQLYLVREIMSHLLQNQPSPIKMHHEIPVSKLANDDELIALVNHGIKSSQYLIIQSFLSTNDGQRIWQSIQANSYSNIKIELNALASLSMTKVHDLSLIGSTEHLFEYNTNKDDVTLLQLIVSLCSLIQDQIPTQLINYFKEFEAEDRTNPVVSFFHNHSYRIILVPVSDASSIIREVGNPEFFDYFKQSTLTIYLKLTD